MVLRVETRSAHKACDGKEEPAVIHINQATQVLRHNRKVFGQRLSSQMLLQKMPDPFVDCAPERGLVMVEGTGNTSQRKQCPNKRFQRIPERLADEAGNGTWACVCERDKSRAQAHKVFREAVRFVFSRNDTNHVLLAHRLVAEHANNNTPAVGHDHACGEWLRAMDQ